MVNGNAERAHSLAVEVPGTAPWLGSGQTMEYFEVLAALACYDLTAPRVAEAHLDALVIVNQAGVEPAELVHAENGPAATWWCAPGLVEVLDQGQTSDPNPAAAQLKRS
ncbi:hypothetical protein E3O44_12030 [Cryobacterium algoricola]|uniref:Uncharacterized protein n=1 Tax=Cryobacterium algoricola TaxID=1259183 RepID=A0ABY2IAZ7_9MICO|nr:hypothetical protein [Cryobacterium algoricola]TFB86329.1 hypothetical protein E3O44_12030 [Cryobacterium algoricola]